MKLRNLFTILFSIFCYIIFFYHLFVYFRRRSLKMSDTEHQRGEKREKSDAESSDDDFVGPSITDAAPPKKKKVLEYEKVC